ncbi:MAG TPA: 30S ribosomal protein S6 [Candidatus Xenobia bacterium]|jgi:small subunit ribosomal protein S6
MTRTYEATYILDPNLTEEDVPKFVEKFQTQVAGKGEVVTVDNWGKRRLSYEIGGRKEGTYVTMRFKATSDVAEELGRVLRLADEVIRNLIVRLN